MKRNHMAERSSKNNEKLQDKNLEDVSGGLFLTDIVTDVAEKVESNKMEKSIVTPVETLSAKEEVDKKTR
ncbi:hypothetical protein [Francisella salimarina]|uniref:hypothetical protein n=1 Tax=Francisella salimarina TaxID=2599927 RepID=UPI00375040A1